MRWDGPTDIADAWVLASWAVKGGPPHPSEWVSELVAEREAAALEALW